MSDWLTDPHGGCCPECQESEHDPECPLVGDGRPVDCEHAFTPSFGQDRRLVGMVCQLCGERRTLPPENTEMHSEAPPPDPGGNSGGAGGA